METKNVFPTLNKIDVNARVEEKNGLKYLSWAWAWGEVKKAFPEAFYTIYENKDGLLYHTDGRTCWVKTGVTIEGLEHIEYLPIMDNRNHSIPLNQLTSMDVNKAVQRSITKACARHGLGLYIYAGEDLPESEDEQPATVAATAKKAPEPKSLSDEQICTKMLAHLKAEPELFARIQRTDYQHVPSVDFFTDSELLAIYKAIKAGRYKA